MRSYKKYQEYLGEIPDFLCKYLGLREIIRLRCITLLCGMRSASEHMYRIVDPYVSRYDHSLNDALIIWRLTHDKKETLAGLFHDVATPTWSHVVDYMNKDFVTQESTEAKTEEILRGIEKLEKCLQLDGLRIEDLIDFKKCSVADLPRPYLCADRVENTISTSFSWFGNITVEQAKMIIDSLKLYQNEFGVREIGFNSTEVAKLFVDLNDCINVATNTKEDTYMMLTASKILERLIELKVLSYDDLFKTTEPTLLELISKTVKRDPVLNEYWKIYTTAEVVPEFELPEIKTLTLNPLVCGKRLIR